VLLLYLKQRLLLLVVVVVVLLLLAGSHEGEGRSSAERHTLPVSSNQAARD
jgi:hypothetical protein